jgi:hypothetical protein
MAYTFPPGFVPEPPEPEPEPEEEDIEDPDLARMGRVLAATEEHLDRAEDVISALYWLAKLGQLEPPGTPAFDISIRMQRAVKLYSEGEDLSDAVGKLMAEYRMRSRPATWQGGE